MRQFIFSIGVLSLPVFVNAAPVPKVRADEEKVVGIWKLVKSSKSRESGPTIHLEMELTQTGKLILRQSTDGGPVSTYEGEYSVSKNELPYSIKSGGTVLKTEVLTIKKLTETELSLVDPEGIQEDFERIKANPTLQIAPPPRRLPQ